MLKRRIVIKGEKVQDVGYRLFLLEAAESLGLKGFQARNVDDYVEFLVEGEEEPVTRFVDFAKKNYPEPAMVNEVFEEPYEGSVMSLEGFYRSFSLSQLVKIVSIGGSILGKQDETLEKKGSMLEKQDTALEKQDVLIDEVRSLRNDLKAYMDERFSKDRAGNN
ncbi:MAG: acylphosphatase [Candidatus Brockarchaeota archaeon]|nr:acylphosphatase [Candidatus Brockarchaeota archaeon]